MSKVFRGKWRLGAVCLVIAALLLGGAALLTTRGSGTAKASGSGGGCTPSTGPVCTFRGLGASAQFTSADPTGCLVTNAVIFAGESITHSPPGGPATTGPGAFLGVFQFDFCHSIVGQQLEGEASSVTFQGDPGLGTATASGTATLFDFNTGAPFQVTFNVTWKGIGQSTSSVGSFHFRSAGTVTNVHGTTTSRLGAASGSITEGSTNFASTPTLVAELFSSNGGTITIDH